MSAATFRANRTEGSIVDVGREKKRPSLERWKAPLAKACRAVRKYLLGQNGGTHAPSLCALSSVLRHGVHAPVHGLRALQGAGHAVPLLWWEANQVRSSRRNNITSQRACREINRTCNALWLYQSVACG